jgi:hypothetical protein
MDAVSRATRAEIARGFAESQAALDASLRYARGFCRKFSSAVIYGMISLRGQ